MAGGVSTPELVMAVCRAGGFGWLAGGYRTAAEVAEQIAAVREAGVETFGVNLFAPEGGPRDAVTREAMRRYRQALQPLAEQLSITLPEAADLEAVEDDWTELIDLLIAQRVPVASVTFGLPAREVVTALHDAGVAVVATVTSPDEARAALHLGVDGLCVQGPEAGGHRGCHDAAAAPDERPLLELVRAVRWLTPLPLAAAGGLTTPDQVAAALAAGADSVQCGTAYLRADEAGTGAVHRAALADPRFTQTEVTRAYTGRLARGLRTEFIERYDDAAPPAYPDIHHLTSPIRRAAAASGDARWVHLWAGTGWREASTGPAAEITRALVGVDPRTT